MFDHAKLQLLDSTTKRAIQRWQYRGHGNTYTTDRPVLADSISVELSSTQLRTRSTSPQWCQAARSSVSGARESRGAHVSRVEDEGWSQFVCSIHVCVFTYTYILTYVRERQKERKGVRK